MAADLCEVSDVVTALGGATLTEAEEAVIADLITRITSYIETQVECGLGELADDDLRLQADYRGVVNLPEGPYTSVTDVVDYLTSEAVTCYWDGADTITGLGSYQTVVVTATHGDSPKAALHNLAVEVVEKWYRDEDAFALLMSKTVGAETLTYSIGARTESVGAAVLNTFRMAADTFYMGPKWETDTDDRGWVINA